MKYHKLCVAVLMFATMIAVGSASAVCSNASLNGVVGYLTTGLAAGVGVTGASMGQMTFDGRGNFRAVAANSAYGTIGPDIFSGTYSVSKSCTGTITVTSPASHTFNIVLDDLHEGFQLIETDGIFLAGGFAVPEGVVTCGLTGKTQTFALNLAGNTINDSGVASPVMGVGQLTLNGAGTLSGNATFNLNGTFSSGSVTGTYTENSNCTGTAQITVSGHPTSHYYFVVVSSGNEMLAIETDTNTVVSGTMQE